MTANKVDVESGGDAEKKNEFVEKVLEGHDNFLKMDDDHMVSELCSLVKKGEVLALKEKLSLLNQKDENRLKKVINKIDKTGEYLFAPLHYAAKHSNYDIMELLLDFGADIDSYDHLNYWKPAHYFAEHGKRPKGAQTADRSFPILDKVKFEEYLTLDDWSLLHLAAKRGNIFTTELILAKPDVNLETKDWYGMRALHFAAIYNQPEVMKLIIEKGAEPDAVDDQGNNCLHFACKNNSTQTIDIILGKGTDIHGKDFILEKLVLVENKDGETPVINALKNNNFKVANRLIHDFGCGSIKSLDQNCALHTAALTGSIPMVKILLKLGAKCNVLDQNQKSPLMVAAENNMVEVAELLLAEDIDVDQKGFKGGTALMTAAIEGSMKMVKLLLDHNSNVDLKDEKERNALHYAANHDNPELLKLLLDSDADKSTLEDQDFENKTPLHIAVQKGNLETFKFLISQGSSMVKRDQTNHCPIHTAATEGRADIIEYMLLENRSLIHSDGPDQMKPLAMAAMANKIKAVEVLLKFGAPQVQEAFEYAVVLGDIECARILLKNGAQVNGVNKKFELSTNSPLSTAASDGNTEMVSFLLKNEADISIANQRGQNALTDCLYGDNAMDVIDIFIRNYVFLEGLRTCMDMNHRNTEIRVPNTPFRSMISLCPPAAWRTLNQLYSYFGADCNCYIDFELLDDNFHFDVVPEDDTRVFRYSENIKDKPYHSDRTLLMENHPLMLMVTHEQTHLLKHPVCKTLLDIKWKKFGRYLYYGMLLAYLLFLATLTTFSLVVTNPSAAVNGTCLINDKCLIKDTPQRVTQWIIIVMVSVSVFSRLVNFMRTRKSYLHWSNLLDVLVHICGLIFVIDIDEESALTGLRKNWQWQLGAITITLAWLNLLSITRNLPLFGIYVIMFIDILKTFTKFAMVFGIFIVAFGIGFHMLLQFQTPFTSIGKSLLKTSVMMIGEFEFESIFYSETNPDNLAYPSITFAFFVGFLIIMSIIIVNLMVGLAVDDIKAVQDQAELKMLAMQVQQVLDVERMLPMFLFEKSILGQETFEIGSSVHAELGRFHKTVEDQSFVNDKAKKQAEKVDEIAKKVSAIEDILKSRPQGNNNHNNIITNSNKSTLPATPTRIPSKAEDEAELILNYLNSTK